MAGKKPQGGTGRAGRDRASGPVGEVLDTKLGPVYKAEYGERFPDELDDIIKGPDGRGQGIVFVGPEGTVYVHPIPRDTKGRRTHASLYREGLGKSKDWYDSSTRLVYSWGGNLHMDMGSAGWGPKGVPEGGPATDSRAIKKATRAANRLVAAGYPGSSMLRYWSPSMSGAISLPITEW